jgi:hypothetical protein
LANFRQDRRLVFLLNVKARLQWVATRTEKAGNSRAVRVAFHPGPAGRMLMGEAGRSTWPPGISGCGPDDDGEPDPAARRSG